MVAAAVGVEVLSNVARFYPLYAGVSDVLFEFVHAGINAGTAWLAAVTYRRTRGREPPEFWASTQTLLLASLVLFAGATLGATALATYAGAPFLATLLNWFTSDLLGVLAFAAPLIMWWFRVQGFKGPMPGSTLELAALVCATYVTATLVFAQQDISADFQLPYLLFPLLLWGSTRFYPSVVSTLAGSLAVYITFLFNHGVSASRVHDASALPEALMPLQLFLCCVLVTALLLSIALNERRRLQRRLRDTLRAVAAAEQDAGRRTAIELRDGIDGQLARIQSELETLRAENAGGPQAEGLREAGELVAAMRRNVGSLAEDLAPLAPPEQDLLLALQALFDRFQREHDLEVKFAARGALSALSPERRSAAFRIVQELLLNVVRHAGVKRADVALAEHGDDVEIRVSDNGRGFVTESFDGYLSGGFGLFSIRDQAIENGGGFELSSAPGRGCRVIVRLAGR
jgi:signal transduction histidine kinase